MPPPVIVGLRAAPHPPAPASRTLALGKYCFAFAVVAFARCRVSGMRAALKEAGGRMIVGYRELAGLAGRVAMVDGCFDPVHGGHLDYFREAARLGVPVLCNVQSDAYIVRTKGRANLLPEDERARLIDSLRDVAYVHVCETSTADVLETLRPAAYVKGGDWRGMLPEEQVALCDRLGIEIVFLDTVTGSSSVTVETFLRRNATVPPPAEQDPSAGSPYRALVTSHSSAYLSGVARFNRLLAERLGVPLLGLSEAVGARGPLLVSVKLTDGDTPDRDEAERALSALLGGGTVFDVFLHGYDDSVLERRLVAGARHAYAGNEEIAAAAAHHGSASALWCPGLIDLGETIGDADLTLLSFGMAHKVRVDRYAALRERLEAVGTDYRLLVSTAFHEKAGLGEIDRTADGLRELFDGRLQLLGFLSDAALNHFLRMSDVFVAFFPRGVRANNTSVLGAMAAGTAVLTNLDGYSPGWMRHAENVLDLDRLRPEDLSPERLDAIRRRAAEDVAAHAGWEPLVERLRGRGAAQAERETARASLPIDGAAERAIPSG